MQNLFCKANKAGFIIHVEKLELPVHYIELRFGQILANLYNVLIFSFACRQ